MTTPEQIDDLIQEVKNQLNESKPKEQTVDEHIKEVKRQLSPQTEQEDDSITSHIEKERKFIKALENQIQKSLKFIWDLEKIKLEKELRKEIEEELETIHYQARKDIREMLEEEDKKLAERHRGYLMNRFTNQ